MSNHLQEHQIDPTRIRYVVMNNQKTSVLMVPYGPNATPQVWWSYDKGAAKLHAKILEKDFNIPSFAVDYRQAIVHLSNHHAQVIEQLKKRK